jgi:hypothetical protein
MEILKADAQELEQDLKEIKKRMEELRNAKPEE